MEAVTKDLGDALPIYHPIVHVEVIQKSDSTAKMEVVVSHVMELLKRHPVVMSDMSWDSFEDSFLQTHVRLVSITDLDLEFNHQKMVELVKTPVEVHVMQLNDDGPSMEELNQGDDNLPAAQHWILPSTEFHGLWESLVYDSEIKLQLLNYVMTTLLFSDKNVNSNVISWNRVVLLHGPPGTGKTSLCKALAQKLCIRLSKKYRYGQLIEINSHSLFSKWFSESGKLVMKMFQKIQESIDDQEALICVLIDEVESLTASRSASHSGTEPSDAIRVVNALLTQIDQIKRYSNVIILTTSNITGKIDAAFVDRADIKQYIGPPSVMAIYQIYLSCLVELINVQCLYLPHSDQLLSFRQLEMMHFVETGMSKSSLRLHTIAEKSQGLSGRVLRKLPFIAHALYVKESTTTLSCFLDALSQAVDRQFTERANLA
uniref:Pachytene checkpoint protein 2 homolog n=1 Tax=Petromyzon marinus TaxID=7757 RepID=S4RT38_PETMA